VYSEKTLLAREIQTGSVQEVVSAERGCNRLATREKAHNSSKVYVAKTLWRGGESLLEDLGQKGSYWELDLPKHAIICIQRWIAA
jgi:hypothetical protein